MTASINCVQSFSDSTTPFKIYKNRSQSCAKALISEDFGGMIITDRHGAYNWIKQEKSQYCWAHLKRDFKKITESVNKDEALIGYKLVDSLKSLFYYWRHLQDGDYYKYQIKRATRNMYSVLRQGKKLLGSKTGKFCAKLLRERKSLWHFLKNDKISPTNNHAERQVRHAVIWRKKCYGTQSARGELFVERILTVLKTCQQKSKNIFEFISRSVRSTWCGDTHPSLVT